MKICPKFNTDKLVKDGFLTSRHAMETTFLTKDRLFRICNKIYNFFNWRIVFVVYSAVLFTLNFVRIFDNDFWIDETFSILRARMSVIEIIQRSTGEQSPPLYYLILKWGISIFGDYDWTYHLVSLLPLAIIMIVFLTYGWKRFGGAVSLLFITFASLMYNALHYHMEVRPYPWAAVFVIVAFLALFEVLKTNSIIAYAVLSIASLAAGFTHYFSLVAVAFLFLTLIVFSFTNKEYLKRTLITSIITLLIYAPWGYVIYRAYASDKEASWLGNYDSFLNCLEFIFEGKLSWLFLIMMLAMILFFLAKAFISGKVEPKHVWIIAGTLSIFGTIGVGVIASEISHPILLVRHIYPVTLIAWLMFSYLLRILTPKYGRLLSISCVVGLLLITLPTYRYILQSEAQIRKALADTLSSIENHLDGDEIIISDLTVTRYYFDSYDIHGYITDRIENEIEIENGKKYFFILDSATNEDFSDRMSKIGYECEKVLKHKYIGTDYADAYFMDTRK